VHRIEKVESGFTLSVKLLPVQHVKAHVRGNKSDYNDENGELDPGKEENGLL
jgi:hypothetical protein